MNNDYLLSVWAYDKDGHKVHPYKGKAGAKKGLYSVNFTNDTNKFQGMTAEELILSIKSGRFRDRHDPHAPRHGQQRHKRFRAGHAQRDASEELLRKARVMRAR